MEDRIEMRYKTIEEVAWQSKNIYYGNDAFLVETTLMARIDCKRLSSVTE
jgi:hypothetical protein